MSELERLHWQLNVSWSLLSLHLEQVTDEEALWEPVSNCRNVRQKTDGRCAADWAVPEPEPIPVSTVGWVVFGRRKADLRYHVTGTPSSA